MVMVVGHELVLEGMSSPIRMQLPREAKVMGKTWKESKEGFIYFD